MKDKKQNPTVLALFLVAVALQLAAMKFVPEAKDAVALLTLVVQASVGSQIEKRPKDEEEQLPEDA